MATHTGGNQDFGRKFQISRLNGQVDKNGEPYFFEWLREGQQPYEGAKVETRGNNIYQLFKALDGHLTGFERKPKTIQDVPRDFLYIELEDGGEKYVIEVGDFDGRFALDLMKRMLNPAFDASAKIRLSPYAIQDKASGKWQIGISTFCGVDKISAKLADIPMLAECPQATSVVFKGQTQWDFSPVAEWLYAKVREKLETFAPSQPAQTNVRASEAANTVHVPANVQTPVGRKEPEIDEPEDLPF